jgi:protein subunit release factor B
MKEYVFSLHREDFEIQTFRSGGKGGQNQNKVESGVRIIHRPSGCTAECRETRDQLQNKRIAFQRIAKDPRMLVWIRMESSKRLLSPEVRKRINREVDLMMDERNLKIEYGGGK